MSKKVCRGGGLSEWKCAGGYRYGFNGKENDNEVKGEGNQQDYGMRVYDPRVAKFLSVDPLAPKYPELTPYQFASNSPIDGTDLDGLEHLTANYQIITRNGKTAVKLVNYYWNYPNHESAGDKGRGIQYNIEVINYDMGKKWNKEHFVSRGAVAEYGNYYGSTPLLTLDKNGDFVKESYNYDLPALGTVDALARIHDKAYDAVRSVGSDGLFADWATTPADEAAADGWKEFVNKYEIGDIDPIGGNRITHNTLAAARKGYTFFYETISRKKNKIALFMSDNYANAKHLYRVSMNNKDREENYQLFLKLYLYKDKDGRYRRIDSMWNRDEKGNYTTPKVKK